MSSVFAVKESSPSDFSQSSTLFQRTFGPVTFKSVSLLSPGGGDVLGHTVIVPGESGLQVCRSGSHLLSSEHVNGQVGTMGTGSVHDGTHGRSPPRSSADRRNENESQRRGLPECVQLNRGVQLDTNPLCT